MFILFKTFNHPYPENMDNIQAELYLLNEYEIKTQHYTWVYVSIHTLSEKSGSFVLCELLN